MGATFRKLISAGITVNAIDNNGKTALYYAIEVTRNLSFLVRNYLDKLFLVSLKLVEWIIKSDITHIM